MAIDEPQVVAIAIRTDPIIKPYDLENVGYLKRESSYVNCPACEREDWSVVQLEAVTCLQRLLNFSKLCKNWSGRTDINHYCKHCGCYIGRFVPINCYERCISRSARNKAAEDNMTLKMKPKDCAVRAQKMREDYLARRAEAQAKKAQQEQQQTTVVTLQVTPQSKTQ